MSSLSLVKFVCLENHEKKHFYNFIMLTAFSINRGGIFGIAKFEIEDIYFFEVNTKYISSNVMEESENSRVLRTREFFDIFNT